jgi:hypothetical protein
MKVHDPTISKASHAMIKLSSGGKGRPHSGGERAALNVAALRPHSRRGRGQCRHASGLHVTKRASRLEKSGDLAKGYRFISLLLDKESSYAICQCAITRSTD